MSYVKYFVSQEPVCERQQKLQADFERAQMKAVGGRVLVEGAML